MAICSMKDILKKAAQGGYAVGFHNVVDSNSLKGILLAAEEQKSPTIIGIAQVQLQDVDLGSILNMLTYECDKVSVPVGIHLDHGLDFDTIKQAIDLGCTSVMFDGSHYDLGKNIELTREITEYAHKAGVSVEGEVGEMGNEQSDKNLYNSKLHMTNPKEAKKFVEETEVDALAVSFGSIHGIQNKKPDLNFSLLKEIKKVVNIPLVMHGGSGFDPEDYLKVIAEGICKINYVSYGYRDVAEILRTYLNNNPKAIYDTSAYTAIRAFADTFGQVMRNFKSAGKA